MRAVCLYAYPPEPDGLSQQGHLLYRGLKENGEKVVPVHMSSDFQKKWVYTNFKPDVAIGIGYWGHTPDLIHNPQRFRITPVPWFVADGWVAGFHKTISELPLVFVTSEWVKSRYARDGVDTKNFEVIHIGTDLGVFKPMPRTNLEVRSVRRLLGVGDDEVMLLTIGGDVTSKGAQEVLKALKRIGHGFTKWRYVCKVWGGASADDHYETEMALIEELGEEKERVQYLEGSFSREFMPFILNAADIYVAPSRLEGFGMIQMEAQACGVPVVSIDAMGPKETIVDGETGLLAPVGEMVELASELAPPVPGLPEGEKIVFDAPKVFAYRADVEQLADRLLRLMQDGKLRQEMGRKARKHAERNFDYRKIARDFAKIVKEKIGIQ